MTELQSKIPSAPYAGIKSPMNIKPSKCHHYRLDMTVGSEDQMKIAQFIPVDFWSLVALVIIPPYIPSISVPRRIL